MIKHLKKIRKRLAFRNSRPIEELPLVQCENCKHQFQGHYCPSCGQEVAEFNRPFGFIFYDFMGNFFAFDTRFYRTFWQLLLRPGFLTVEFFNGHRVRYSPPFRIFIFLSFVLFLLLEIFTQQGINKVLNSDPKKITATLLSDSTNQEVASIPLEQAAQLPDTITKAKETVFTLNDFKAASIREVLEKEANRREIELQQITDPKRRQEEISFIHMFRTPELVIAKTLKYLSWAFFILLPLFALLLKLFYIRRKQYFIRHLFFSIHLHSYLFFILILVLSINYLFATGTGTISGILLVSFPIYFILALRKFYGQGIRKTIIKFLLISIMYNIILLTTAGIVISKALGFI